ncbi:MAG: NUDIX domain-containing protein [Candidatus Neomarinimicrobiota bacterium]|nr:NUDIX domain-containing protein [Candidatus Neomarinimicrobiota bacterium]
MTEVSVTHIDSYLYRQDKNGHLLYLMLKRRPDKQYGHLWQGVAGQIEEGETAVETVLREINEETGLKPLRLFTADHVTAFYQSYNDRMNLVPVFGVEVGSEEVRLSCEHENYRWERFEEAVKMLTWNQQKKALSVINAMLFLDDRRINWSEVEIDDQADGA